MSPETFASSAIILTQKNKNARKNSIKIKTFKSSPPLEILSKKYYNNMMWAWGAQQSTTKEAVMAEVMDNVKDFIEKYCKILHLANMPANVRARFDKLAKNKDFAGDMKRWPDLLELADRVKKGDLSALPTLRDEKWADLYARFQGIFEKMSQNTDDFKYKAKTKEFFEKWYGDGKLFNTAQPIDGLETRIAHFAKFLETHKFSLSSVISTKNVYGLPEDFKYDSFVSDLKSKKFLNDPEFRDLLFTVVKYVQEYSDGQNYYYPWGKNPDGTKLEQYNFAQPVKDATGAEIAPALPLDTDEWFNVKYNRGFKHHAMEIFNKLLTSSAVLDDFQNYDYRGKITKHIKQAISETDYANKDSKNYVSPLYTDEKTFLQNVGDKIEEFGNDKLDSWGRILTLRGTRRFFSPFSRTIIESLSKVKIKDKDGKTHPLKPTDGLKGILDNTDAIKGKLQEKSNKAVEHFDWFAGKLKIYSEKMPKAFNGALHNSKQMRAIVSQIIVDAINDGKMDEAKTALEIMSTMKYGIFHSNVVDALKAENFNIVGDKGLSWNKYEGVKFVTSAMDLTAKYAILGAGRALVAIRNGAFNLNTKFRGNTKTIDKAHKQWQEQNGVGTVDALLQSVDTDIQRETRRQNSINKWINKHGGITTIENIVNLNTDVQKLQQQIQDKQSGIEQISAELDQINQNIDELKRQPQSGNQILDKNGNPIPVQNAEISQLISEKQQLEFALRTSRAELANLTSDINSKNSQLTPHINDVDKYKIVLDKLNDAQENIDAWNAQKTNLETKKTTWNDDHTDKYMELMAFWDMLESHWKSHQFTLSAKWMRDKFLENNKNTSVFDAYKAKYQNAA